MVSFQCDGCSDVVKKPKLDQHHSRGCGASFTCIDCSKTFQTPADWKSHTSCISEAQKYQKTLYKPKLNGGGREDYHQAASNGKFQGGWNKPPTRWQATGANGTPLGTPTRMSPVTISPPLENEQKSAPVPTVGKDTGSKPEKSEKTHKKRKPEGVDVRAGPTEVDPCPQEKLKTKEKKAKKEDKQKKQKMASGAASKKSVGAETTEISTRSVEIQTITSSHSLDIDSETLNKSKKRKKENKHTKSTVVGSEVAISDPLSQATAGDHEQRDGMDEGKKKKKKKHKSEMAVTGPEVNSDLALPTPEASIHPPEKKSKKRKRETEETDMAKGVGEIEIEKKIKKKRASAGQPY